MPCYLHQWKYKDAQIKKMVQDVEDLNREEVIRSATAAFNGRLLAFYFCFGEFDGVAISEFPDEKSALACAMSIYGQGRLLDVRTTPLFTMNEGIEAFRHIQTVTRKGDVPPEQAKPGS